MTEDTITDLKIYMATLIGQQVGGLRDDMNDRFTEIDTRFASMDKKFTNMFAGLDQKIDDLSDSVGEALHNFDTATEEKLQNHATRITKLETSNI